MKKLSLVTLMEELSDEQKSDLYKQMAVWGDLKKQLALIEALGSKLKSRISGIEDRIEKVQKDNQELILTLDTCVAEIKSRRNTSVPYKDVVAKALEIANSKQRAVLEQFIETVTSSYIKESISVSDKKLKLVIAELNEVPEDKLIKLVRKIKEIPDAAPAAEVEEGLVSIAKTVINKILGMFDKVSRKQDEAEKAISKLKELLKKK